MFDTLKSENFETMTTGLVTPGDVIGKATEFKAGKGAYVNDATIYASLTGTCRIVSPLPESIDQVSSLFQVINSSGTSIRNRNRNRWIVILVFVIVMDI